MKKILVTGASGCLGSRIANDLINQGHEVVILVRKTSDLRPLHKSENLKFAIGDLLDLEFLKKAVSDCAVVIHCAADLHFIPRSQEEFSRSQTVNVVGTKNIIQACLESGVKQFIHMSSIAAMGDFYNLERDETFPCTPESFYGQNKLDSEKIVNSYQNRGINITILRPGVIYGAWDRGTILKMIKYIHTGKFRFIGDNLNHKSLVSVGNVSAAAMAVMENPAAYGETFIIVDQEKLTMKTIAEIIARKLKVKLPRFRIPLWFGYFTGWSCDLLAKITRVSWPLSLQNVKNFTHSATYSSKKLHEKINFFWPENFQNSIDQEIDWYLNVYLNDRNKRTLTGGNGGQSKNAYYESTELMAYSVQKKIKFDLFHEEIRADRNDLVLDIGAGSGIFSKRISAEVKAVICLDNSLKALENTKENLKAFPNILYVVGDATRMPFKSNVFDKVIAADVLEHIPDDRGVIREIARIQKSRGLFIASTPCHDATISLDWFRRLIGFRIEKSFGHVRRGYDLREFKELLGEMFKLLKTKYYFQFFGEIVRILLYVVRTVMNGNRNWTEGEDSAQIENSKTFKIYKYFYPLMLRFTKLDELISKLKGHQIMIIAERKNKEKQNV